MSTKRKTIPIVERPTCAVRGLIVAPTKQGFGSMCGKVGVGGRSCHYEGKCEHQRAASSAQGKQ